MASQVIATGKGDLSVTFSMGIADLKQTKDSTLEMLLAHADQALYAAKQAGRSQLVIYSASHWEAPHFLLLK